MKRDKNKKRSPRYSFPVMFARNSLYDSNTRPGTIKRLNYDARQSTVTRIIQDKKRKGKERKRKRILTKEYMDSFLCPLVNPAKSFACLQSFIYDNGNVKKVKKQN